MPRVPLCGFVCDLLLERCPEEIDTYNLMCNATSSDIRCSSAIRSQTHAFLPLAVLSTFVYYFYS